MNNQLKNALTIYIIFVVLILAIIGSINKAADSYGREDFEPVVHTMRSGETPWEIASQLCPDTLDKRVYLEWCAKENGFNTWGIVYPGEKYIFLELKGEEK